MILKDKVAIVTGAGRGWGQSVALAYARQGAKVIVVSRTQSEIDHTVSMIQAEGGHAVGKSIDVSDDTALQEFHDWVIKTYGRLDVLVNNAAVLIIKEFEELTQKEIDLTLNINLRAVIVMNKLFLQDMIRQGQGSIINVSSNAGVNGFEKESVYSTCKFGLEGFTKSLALEIRKHNIAVNTITPGGMSAGVRIKPTSLTQEAYDALPESEKKQWVDSIVSTEAFIFLALQDGKGVSGERIMAYELSEQIRQEGYQLKYQPYQG
jgi:NAD(P)-dependent dehydrogenase (short-subunit alcohol dehydrogenase family)